MTDSDDDTEYRWSIYQAPPGVDFVKVPVDDDTETSDDEIVELDHGTTVKQSNLLEGND